MDREFLEMLYDVRTEKKRELNELVSRHDFPSSECWIVEHDTKLDAAKESFALINKIIDAYWRTGES